MTNAQNVSLQLLFESHLQAGGEFGELPPRHSTVSKLKGSR
jgi:hypothetical protein